MRVRDFLILSFLVIGLINFTFISAYLVFSQYGSVTLNPGEKYTINIPFFDDIPSFEESKSPVICGKAETTSGEALQGVNVSVYFNTTLINKSTTDSNGKYCISLPEITSSKKYNIFIEHNNQTNTGSPIQLASNDYYLDFDNNLVFSKISDRYAVLQGAIDNEDAEIDNGRVEVNLKYYENSTWKEIFDYQKYFVNIDSREVYDVPSDELNVSWQIPNDAKVGRYKFYIKTSFNAKERTKDVYFNITA